jgi:hypothetical protein
MRARLAECSLGLESSPEQPRGKHIWGWSPGEAQESNTMGKALRSDRAFVGNGHQVQGTCRSFRARSPFCIPGLRFISASSSNAELANALRRRRTVSVCSVLKSAKRGRFAYFALKLDDMSRQ